MNDIISFKPGKDIEFADSVVGKAANVVSVQIGSLEYEPTFGSDLNYFLQSQFQIQTASFKNYLVGQLVKNQINVTQCIQTINTLFEELDFFVDDANNSVKGLIA